LNPPQYYDTLYAAVYSFRVDPAFSVADRYAEIV